ncbi:MAG: anthranilate phosphoribosyltransferase [Dehalococcoidia bacterium]|nr:anthranilate phosphoribosyltransferase [Dehalococcoidia bacterium]
MIREAIIALVDEGRELTEAEAAAVMHEIMRGEATPAQFGAFVTALRLRGETAPVVIGMAKAMREHALRVEVKVRPLLDTCGTGGTGVNTFNVSTAAAFVAAAAGAHVAKHGNRAMTSTSGSADLLEALGAEIMLTPQQVAACIERTGVGFMFAQAFHPAMKFAGPLRREIGVRTVFNILGPLTNPASANCHVLGAPDEARAELLAQTLTGLDMRHALVVTGEGGIDELSVSGPTTVFEVKGQQATKRTVTPGELGVAIHPLSALTGGTPQQNAETLRLVFAGEGPPAIRDFIAVNAGAGIYVAGLAATLRDGTRLAQAAIDSGDAAARVAAFVEATRRAG